jgi:acid phosphatase type 7
MMKPKTLGLALLAMAFWAALFAQADAVPQRPDVGVDYWAPWVTNLATHSATVNWRAEDLGSGSVEYATSSYYKKHKSFKKLGASQTTGPYQHVQLTGLEPNTSYVYRVRPSDNPDVFSNRTFRTMPVSGPFTFIVISDSHAQEKRFKYVADAIATHETDALFILDGGDYAGWDKEEFWTTYFQYADGMLAKFPIFHTIGNHEYHNNGHPDGPPTNADQYHWTFDVPADAALNYSFDCSGIRFVVLNSPDPNNANGDDPHTSLALAQSQSAWLRKQLDNHKLGTFTIHHHPIWDYYSADMNPDLEPWESLYHAYPISANFAGHTHNYQRYSVGGIPYFVVGNAGGKFADLDPGEPYPLGYVYGETRMLGYLKVTVYPKTNTAIAQEIFAAWVEEDTSETATVYDPPVVADVVTFPLKRARGSSDGSNSPDVSDPVPSNGAPE